MDACVASCIILSAKPLCLYCSVEREGIGVSAAVARKGDHLRAAASAGTLVGDLNSVLSAGGTKPPFDRIKLCFFLFEIVEIAHDRSGQNDKHKKYDIESIHPGSFIDRF